MIIFLKNNSDYNQNTINIAWIMHQLKFKKSLLNFISNTFSPSSYLNLTFTNFSYYFFNKNMFGLFFSFLQVALISIFISILNLVVLRQSVKKLRSSFFLWIHNKLFLPFFSFEVRLTESPLKNKCVHLK